MANVSRYQPVGGKGQKEPQQGDYDGRNHGSGRPVLVFSSLLCVLRMLKTFAEHHGGETSFVALVECGLLRGIRSNTTNNSKKVPIWAALVFEGKHPMSATNHFCYVGR